MGIRLDIFVYKIMSCNQESDHLKLTCKFFKKISYTTHVFLKTNEVKIRLKYESIFPKVNELKTDSYTDDVPKYRKKHLNFYNSREEISKK